MNKFIIFYLLLFLFSCNRDPDIILRKKRQECFDNLRTFELMKEIIFLDFRKNGEYSENKNVDFLWQENSKRRNEINSLLSSLDIYESRVYSSKFQYKNKDTFLIREINFIVKNRDGLRGNSFKYIFKSGIKNNPDYISKSYSELHVKDCWYVAVEK